MGIWWSSVSSKDFERLQTEFQHLVKDNEDLKKTIQKIHSRDTNGLKETIPQKDLLQYIKDINVYLKVAVIAIPISLLGLYAIKKLLTRSGKVEEGSYLLPKPWRKIHQKSTEDSKIKEDFVKRISEIWPQNDTTLNILLLGQAGSGKSSFVNACKTALLHDGRLIKRAPAGGMGSDSYTLKLISYKLEIKNGLEKKYLPVQLFDCRGLFKEKKGVLTEDIKKICRGHIKSGYLINPEEGIKSSDKMYRENPQEEDKMHCIVYVLAADEPGFVQKDVMEQLKEINKSFREDTPQLILLTKIDRIGINNITQIFSDKRVEECCENAAAFLDLCVNDVFPQSNCGNEVIPCDYKDLITLFNIKTIMERANDRVNESAQADEDTITDSDALNSSGSL